MNGCRCVVNGNTPFFDDRWRPRRELFRRPAVVTVASVQFMPTQQCDLLLSWTVQPRRWKPGGYIMRFKVANGMLYAVDAKIVDDSKAPSA